MKRLVWAILAVAVLFVSCAEEQQKSADHSSAIHQKPLYAKGFDIYQHPDFVEIQLFNPWNYTETVARYYLVKSDSTPTPADGLKIRIPLRKVAATSVTQYEFLAMLGQINTIGGICQPELTYNAAIRERYNQHKISNLGDSYNLNRERIALLAPDVVFATFYGPSSISKQLTDNSHITTVYDNEWTETTLLGRAEWIKFIAAFYDQAELADSLFQTIDSAYNACRDMAAEVKNHKAVMLGNNYRGTWYMPGGQSYMGRLLADAGADYAYSNDTSNVSLPLNFETVLKQFHQADVWLNAPTRTIDELIRTDERHKLFHPVETGEVYAFMRLVNDQGANDFWESGVAHPDIILKDFVWALYPELLPNYQPRYIIKCQ